MIQGLRYYIDCKSSLFWSHCYIKKILDKHKKRLILLLRFVLFKSLIKFENTYSSYYLNESNFVDGDALFFPFPLYLKWNFEVNCSFSRTVFFRFWVFISTAERLSEGSHDKLKLICSGAKWDVLPFVSVSQGICLFHM